MCNQISNFPICSVGPKRSRERYLSHLNGAFVNAVGSRAPTQVRPLMMAVRLPPARNHGERLSMVVSCLVDVLGKPE
jgi:hypothetical protein